MARPVLARFDDFGVSQIPLRSFWRDRDVIDVPNVANQTSFFFQFRFNFGLDRVIENENNGILVYLIYTGTPGIFVKCCVT